MFRRSMARLVSPRVQALRQIDGWPVEFAAAGVVDPDGRPRRRGDTTPFARLGLEAGRALATLVAAEEGVVDLDEPAGPPGSTVRHLLAHTSGCRSRAGADRAPGHRRIYSNEAFRVLATHLAARAEMPFAEYVREAVCEPLGIGPRPERAIRPRACTRSLDDVLAIGRELLAPRLVADETRDEMTSVQFPALSGVLPDYGRFDPLDWGLGVQLNTRPPTWMGRARRRHVRPLRRLGDVPLGRSGRASVVCAALTTREFDEWAKKAWPRFRRRGRGELRPWPSRR